MAYGKESRIEQVLKFFGHDLAKKNELQMVVDYAAKLCEKDTAAITILDDWSSNCLRVTSGMVYVDSQPQENSFCRLTTEKGNLTVVPDARADAIFKRSAFSKANSRIRFYAGVPLLLGNGMAIGSLCVFDTNPGNISEQQKDILQLLARQVVFMLELELGKYELKKQIEEKDAKNDALMKIAQLQSHQIRQPLTSIMGLVNLITDSHQAVDEEWLAMFKKATGNFDAVIREIVAESMAEKDLKAIRFNKMVEEIDDYAILLINRHGYVENWNKGARKIKGYDAEEVIGKHFSLFYTEEDRIAGRPARLIELAAEQGVARDEGWRVRKDGSLFWGSIVITAIHDSNKNILGFTKVTKDLTDITSTRDSLAASKQLYNHILEQTSRLARVGGWELDLIENKLSWTEVTREIHGVDIDFEPDLATAINFYKKGFSRNKIRKALKLAIEEGKCWDLELKLITMPGKEIWVRAIGNSNYKNGVCTKVYGTFQDVSKHKKRISFEGVRNALK